MLQLHRFCIATVAIHLVVDKMTMRTDYKGFLHGYASNLVSTECKQQYATKVLLTSGHDPFEIHKEELWDNSDMWPEVCKVHLLGLRQGSCKILSTKICRTYTKRFLHSNSSFLFTEKLTHGGSCDN